MKQNVYISNGKRPWWHTLFATLFFTTSFFIFYSLFFDVSFLPTSRDYGNLIYVSCFSFMMGIRYAEVIDYEFDFNEKIYHKIRTFGILKYRKKYPFTQLKYVAVFDNKHTDVYEVNLWHGKNKRFLISTFNNPEIALQVGGQIATSLSIDLWDATNPSEGKWGVLD